MKIKGNFWIAVLISLVVGVLIYHIIDPFITATFWSVPCSGGTDPNIRCGNMDGRVLWIIFIIYGIITSGIAGLLYRKKAGLIAFMIGLFITLFLIVLSSINGGGLWSQDTSFTGDILLRPDRWGWIVGGTLTAIYFCFLDKKVIRSRKTN